MFWMIMAAVVVFAVVGALSFWLGARLTWKRFMRDDSFSEFVKYHLYFSEILALAEKNKRIKFQPKFADAEDSNEQTGSSRY